VAAVNSLREAAMAVQQRAYAPYSGFRVGAALETSEGTIVTGCNVENAAYGATICAERAAIAAAVATGYTSFTRLALVSDSPRPITPCGTCRQVLNEFGPGIVVESWAGDTVQRWTVSELLPGAFSREHLS